ncbi:hypothetical protein EF903_06960 [Streptomyces sp. WAC05292]|uniref:hypothetical protein n=1 Tax=Streptomyces sp. WAC05292 TaxID=2487418 RepID=UPI000F7376AC|nr:hypothetical protein [Streptomyces sp. WAC05292]RSS94271.1 hypothetical protein EF903_06960 [Streptomyces sp. WAC05292]
MNRNAGVAVELTEPVENRPWRSEDGPRPTVWSWPAGDRPALYVWSRGRWRYAPVHARQDWQDRTVYQVAVDLDGSTSVVARSYTWPQPGLRVAHRSRSQPSSSGPPVLAARGGAARIDGAGA